MPTSKKTPKKTSRPVLRMHTSDVFVAKSAKNRTYIEQLNITGHNFTQKHLGTTCGFFVVRDKSSWSAHIVHFLTAEYKKEYFAQPKRSLSESFAAALHHTNRALAELAKNDNINWIGMLDSALCVYDDKEIHFSVTGEGAVLLLRQGELINISEGLSPDMSNPNPLKTFIDTASGELVVGDKIIITSSELLDLVPLDELAKNALRFSTNEFLQFISTVLTNECDIASTQIIDVREAPSLNAKNSSPNKITDEAPFDSTQSDDEVDLPDNAFSATAYKKSKLKAKKTTTKKTKARKKTSPAPDEIIESLPPEGDYVDKRTGHIYVSGDSYEGEQSTFSPLLEGVRDTATDASYLAKKHAKRSGKKIRVFTAAIPRITRVFLVRILPTRKDTQDTLTSTHEPTLRENSSRSITSFIQRTKSTAQDAARTTKAKLRTHDVVDTEDEAETVLDAIATEQKTSTHEKVTKSAAMPTKAPVTPQQKDITEVTEVTPEKRIDMLTALYSEHTGTKESAPSASPDISISPANKYTAMIGSFVTNSAKKLSKITQKISSQFSQSTNETSDQTKTSVVQKTLRRIFTLWAQSSFLAKAIIVVAILFLISSQLYSKAVTSKKAQAESEAAAQAQQEKTFEESLQATTEDSAPSAAESPSPTELSSIAQPTIVSKNTQASSVETFNGILLFPRGDRILALQGGSPEEFPLPKNAGNIVHATMMDAVGLLIVFTDKDLLYAFNPKTNVFTEQVLSTTIDHTAITAISSYQRKLYVATTNAITRYDRSVSGFDKARDWITDGTQINNLTALAVDGNVFVAANDTVLAFESGTKKSITFDDNIKASHITTAEKSTYLWVLDTGKSTIHKIQKNTLKSQEQFFHKDLSDANAFTVDETNNKAYVAGKNDIKSFQLKNN